MTEEYTEVMKCITPGCGELFTVADKEFKFPNNDARHVRCPKCWQIYKITN